MGSWVKQNAAAAGAIAFVVATLGIGAIVLIARNLEDLGDLGFMLIPVLVIVGLAVAGALVTLAAAGLAAVGARGDAGAPTAGPPH